MTSFSVPQSQPLYLTFSEAAEYLSVTVDDIKQLVAHRGMPVLQLNRTVKIPRWSLEAYRRAHQR